MSSGTGTDRKHAEWIGLAPQWWEFRRWRGARAGSTRHRIKYSGRSLRTSTVPQERPHGVLYLERRRRADEVLEALVRASQRGVSCRVLVDALGARPWWKGPQPERLREAGVQVRPALPVGLFQTLVSRNDLRLHRKIVVVDGEVAWTGSMNLVDPRYFKQDANVGQWVDAMVRVEGTVVVPLAMTMIGDWMLETAESIETIIESAGLGLVEPKGTRMCRSSPRDRARVMTASYRCSLRSSTLPARNSC